jgi:hypothetical protein
MSTKEMLLQEIESMSESQLAKILELAHAIKLNQSKMPESKPPHRKGSGKSILRHAGKWVGDDLKECLEAVYTSRGLAEF